MNPTLPGNDPALDLSPGDLDAVIIAGDLPLEVLGKEEREKGRLSVEGAPATLSFLQHYFQHGRDVAQAPGGLR
jgi:hypothetical protein